VTRKALALLIGLVMAAGIRAATASDGAISDEALRSFEKGKSTLADVTGKLGDPTKTVTDSEGLQAILYPASGASPDPDAAAALFASIGKFASAAVTEGQGVLRTAGFVFDRQDRLVYFRAAVGNKVVTSEDGAGPMPNVVYGLSEQQSQISINQQAASDRPRLGLQLVPTDSTDSKHRKDFEAAKFKGMVVVKVIPGSAADKAGVAQQDYIYLVNGYLVGSFDDVVKAMASVNKGDTVRLRARRIDQSTNLVSERVFDVKL
jgi:hypothetical protein